MYHTPVQQQQRRQQTATVLARVVLLGGGAAVADLGIYKGGFQFRRWKYILT